MILDAYTAHGKTVTDHIRTTAGHVLFRDVARPTRRARCLRVLLGDIRAGQIGLRGYVRLLAMNQLFQQVSSTARTGDFMISAVVFDAFGTLLNLESKRHPFRHLLKEGIAAGRRPSPDDVREMMSNPWSLRDAADHLSISVLSSRLQALQDELNSEVESIRPFADGVEAVALLRAEGVRVGICSNLCEPYGAAVLQAFPDLDGYAFSYQIGAMKPDAVIYQSICNALQVTPGHLFGAQHDQDGGRFAEVRSRWAQGGGDAGVSFG